MKIFLLLLFTFLVGCAGPSITWKSDPPGATVTVQNINGEYLNYRTPIKILYPSLSTNGYRIDKGKCMMTPLVRWSDGTTLDSFQYCPPFLWDSEYTFTKPSAPPVSTFQPNASPVQQNSTSMDNAKKKCSDLGFKSGTEGFGKCVLQLSK